MSSVGDVLINELVNAVNETKEEEEEGKTEVCEIKIKKKGYDIVEVEDADYLINEIDNTLYDVNTFDEIGTWDPVSKKKVDLVASDED